VIHDCLIDSTYTKLACIAQNNAAQPIYIRRCELTQFNSEAINMRKGHIIDSYIHLSKADGLKLDGDDIIVDNCLVRQLGQIDIGAHGDCVQLQNTQRVTIMRSTLYMPGTGTTYDEATNGSTNVLRIATENASYSISDVLACGNILIGGGYAIQIASRFGGSVVENIIIMNNILGTTGAYEVYGNITNDHHLGAQPGITRNIILYNNKRIGGGGLTYAGNDQNGLWRYDKQYANERFLEIGKRIGFLDWNGDPLVTNRTT